MSPWFRAGSATRAVRRTAAPLLVSLAVGATAGTVVSIAVPTVAFAESTRSMEAQFVAKVNAAREANGQQPYALLADLTAVARQHSATMAAQQSLYHTPGLTTLVQNWQAVGENVGEGPSVADVAVAFIQSPEHRANILDHDFTQIGVGVSVDRNGTVWVTQDFREPMSGSSAGTAGSSTRSRSSSASHAVSSSGSMARATAITHGAPAVGTYTPVVSPRPAPSPRAILMQRLRQLRRQHPSSARRDPVSQSFLYVRNLSHLTA